MSRPDPKGVAGFPIGTRGGSELSERLEIARELGCSVTDLPVGLAAAREVLAARVRQAGRIRPRGVASVSGGWWAAPADLALLVEPLDGSTVVFERADGLQVKAWRDDRQISAHVDDVFERRWFVDHGDYVGRPLLTWAELVAQAVALGVLPSLLPQAAVAVRGESR